jgi:hypothetical protein
MALNNNDNSDKGMFLDLNANPSESEKLIIKFTNPIIPIPKTDQKMVQLSIIKLLPYKANAKFPLAKVM